MHQSTNNKTATNSKSCSSSSSDDKPGHSRCRGTCSSKSQSSSELSTPTSIRYQMKNTLSHNHAVFLWHLWQMCTDFNNLSAITFWDELQKKTFHTLVIYHLASNLLLHYLAKSDFQLHNFTAKLLSSKVCKYLHRCHVLCRLICNITVFSKYSPSACTNALSRACHLSMDASMLCQMFNRPCCKTLRWCQNQIRQWYSEK